MGEGPLTDQGCLGKPGGAGGEQHDPRHFRVECVRFEDHANLRRSEIIIGHVPPGAQRQDRVADHNARPFGIRPLSRDYVIASTLMIHSMRLLITTATLVP